MISNIPVWVFFIFASLVFIGYRQTRTREVGVGVVAVLALSMFGLSLYGVIAAFGANTVALGAWALGVATSVTFGRGVFGPRGLVALSAARVQVPGSWLPLALMMGIFAAKFVLGFATGVGSPIVKQLWFMAGASAVFGLLSGAFTARALVVHAFAREARSAEGTGSVGVAC
jgi:hypothetical protein